MSEINQGGFNPAELLQQKRTDDTNATPVASSVNNDNVNKAETPLQKLIRERKERGKGVTYSNAEIAAANDNKLRSEADSEQRREEFNKSLDDLDSMINAAKEIKIVNRPQNDDDMVRVMDEIESYSKTGKIPEDAKMIRLKTDEDDKSSNEAVSSEEDTNYDETTGTSSADSERLRIAEVLIDKTGLGSDVHFTEEERQKLMKATQIRVKEIQDVTMLSTNVEASQKSFLETISEHQISSTMTNVMLPTSGISLSVKGLSFGELSDIALAHDNMTFSKLNKKLSVIYNNIVNSSIGKFESYEDFLKSIAYTDIDFGTFGLVCSTMPEEDTILLTCQKKGCEEQFEHAYSPRSLLQFRSMSKTILKGFDAITKACNPTEAKKVHEESFFKKRKIIRLPESKYDVEIGVASAYEYLHETMNEILEDKFSKEHPDDVNGSLVINTLFISMIRSIAVPINGKYVKYTNAEDIIQILYTLKPGDTPILSQIVSAYIQALNAEFALKDVVCPHCGTVSKVVPIDINMLVFMKQQMLTNTRVDLSEMLDL